MPIQFSCFISYRHSSVKSGASFVRDFVEGFEEELGRWVNYPISFDERRLQAADFIDESLAEKLHGSACMLVLYTPNYFSSVKPFCSREYFGMMELESLRLPQLQGEHARGLVIPVALRDQATMVQHVQNAEQQWCAARQVSARNRLGLSFEQFSKKRQLQPGGNLNAELQNICRVIHDREYAFEALIANGQDPFTNAAAWQLPAEGTVKPWINGLLGFVKQPQLASKAA
ncbi:MAG: toll/interleukin-1 receptor domain-containing protein [Acidobacteriaceae bacterium]|nr:toll/interleukin-1 receptor domain-containing protein [Acidobacteriaceae bacterium]